MADKVASINASAAASGQTEKETETPSPPTSSPLSQQQQLLPLQTQTPPPDRGLTAWLQVLGAFFLWWNTWGLINSYGAWQSYYTVSLLHDRTPMDIAWIGSIQTFLGVAVGVLTGPFYDAGWFRTLLSVGSFMLVFGIFMTSIAKEYWQIMLAQGLCTGIGIGCLFTPSLAHISTYFSTKVPIATGLAALGSGISGTILPVIFHRLQPRIGFPWATRVVGFICLGTLAVPMLVMKVRPGGLPLQRRKIFDSGPWQDPAYCTWVLGGSICLMGFWTPFYYVGIYAFEVGAASQATAFYLISVVTGGSIIGRLAPNLLALRIGMFNVVIPCIIFTGALAFALIGAKTLASIIVVSVLYGLFSGAIISIVPMLAIQLCPTRGTVGNRIGMAFGVASIAILIGTPITGNLLDNYGFNAAWAFSGTCAFVGALALAASRVLFGGWTIMKKM